jgi:hypothetical protein
MNPGHLPCVAIILAVCAVVLCVALSFWIDGWKRIFGAGGGVEIANTQDRLNRPIKVADEADTAGTCVRPTRTIPNEQAKRRTMWAKIVRKM